MTAPTPEEALAAAKKLKDSLLKNRSKYSVHDVYVFGSAIRGDAHEESDIDIAVICDPFEDSKVKEARTFYASWPERDVRIEIAILHPEDLDNKYLVIPQAIKKEGVRIE